MKKIVVISVTLIIIITSSLACTMVDDDTPVTCEEMFQDIEALRTSIIDFAATSICNDEFECHYIAFGSKPCGGPWEFLIYTTSIDTEELETLVAELNELETEYNLNCGAVSDCSTPIEPISFTCEDSQCIPVF